MNVEELFSLNNKCAVVIGGAGKIGWPVSDALRYLTGSVIPVDGGFAIT